MEKKEKTPVDLERAFDEWKSKKGEKLLKLYQEKAAKEREGKDFSPISEKIKKIETSIEQKKATLDKRLSALYARIYKAGASNEAKKLRQERTHHLCNLGGLVEKAGLGDMPPDVLLGMLIQQAEYLKGNPTIVNRWKERGQTELAHKEELS